MRKTNSEVISCPICCDYGKQCVQTLDDKTHDPYIIFRCKNCKHKWFANSNRMPYVEAKKIVERKTPNFIKWTYKTLPKNLMVPEKLSILDVGCWDGSLLKCMPNSWELHGIEPNKNAASRAKLKNIKVFESYIENTKLESNYYDIVFMMNILEHFKNPISAIKIVSKCMKKNALFFAVTGNSESFFARLFKGKWYYFNYAEHLNYFFT